MEAEGRVLAQVRPVLEREVAHQDLHRVAVVSRAPLRRRSSLFFLGLPDDGAPGAADCCRWVVKQPHSDSRQHDLASPLSAEDQFRALRRLHAHLEASDGVVSVPRPVGFVPGLSAYVMEYVHGPTVMALIGPAAVVRPAPLLEGVRACAAVLRAVHSLEPAVEEVLDLSELAARTSTRAPGLLRDAGLPVRQGWFEGHVPAATTANGSKVLLHGDFAPENVVLADSGLFCLDADLADKDWAENDVVRFLVMLFDAPLFVTGADLPPVRSLRRRSARAFLGAYYGDRPWPASLRPLMLDAVAARWSTRHTDVTQRSPRLGRSRQLLLRRHFSTVLDEISSPGWPSRS